MTPLYIISSCSDINSSVSHVLVLPPRPNSLPAMTPAEDGGMDFTCMMDDFDTSDVTLPGTLNEELFSVSHQYTLTVHVVIFILYRS